MKDVIIVANFCNFAGNNRFLYLANILASDAHVEIVTTDFLHSKKIHRNSAGEHISGAFPFLVTELHEPGYPKNICLKRFYSHSVWGKNVIKYLEERKKPDVIYCAVPSLTAPAYVADYCKENHVKFIIDIQDLWPEAFQMVFNPPVLNTLIYAPFKKIADKIYSSADEICAVSSTYAERALQVNQKCKKGHVVFLGTNLQTFDENARNHPVKNKPDNELWLAYCGTLGASYDLTCVFDALEIVKKKGFTPPKFIIMGHGPRRAEFEAYAKAKKIDAIFTGRLPYDQMCSMLCACDITVNPITKGAAQSIINKHGDYAASGLPVINTQECNEYRSLVERFKMGINCENGNADEVAKAIIKLIEDKPLRLKMGKNARKCAEECFDREKTYQKIFSLF